MDKFAERYDIDTDGIMFAGGEPFDVTAVGAAQTPWWNRTLCSVNDTWVRLGVMDGDFHWHRHEDTDEPRRVCRRLFGLSHAAIGCCSIMA